MTFSKQSSVSRERTAPDRSLHVELRIGTELAVALADERTGPLPEEIMIKTEALKFTEPRVFDPSYWPLFS